MFRGRGVSILLALTLAAGCGTEDVGPQPATLLLAVVVAPAGTIESLHVMVAGEGMPQPLDVVLPAVNGSIVGTVSVLQGTDRTITFRAVNASGAPTHRGSVTAALIAGVFTPFTVSLEPESAGPPVSVLVTGLTVTVEPAEDTVVAGGQPLQLQATTTAGGLRLDIPVEWSVRQPGLATVDQQGRLRGIAPGLVEVVAGAGTWSGSATVTVIGTADVAPRLQLVIDGVDRPVFVAAPRTDTSRIFLVLQRGEIRVLRNDTLLAAPVLDLRGRVSTGEEQGLLGMAFDPDYAVNGRVYVYFTNVEWHTRLVRYTRSTDPDVLDPASAETLLTQTQPFSNHNGGMLAFGPDGYLYVGLGDGGAGGDPLDAGQSLSMLLGKVLRLDVRGAPYAIPPTNPYRTVTGARPEIWALGLRNPWRFSFDRSTGDLYIADVGQGQREEINVQPRLSIGGENYGWNIMEGSQCFLAPSCSTAGLTLPVHEYDHSQGCSITGGYVYRGERIPMLRGRYLFADYCQGWVRSLTWSGGSVTDVRDWPALAPGGPIASFGEDGRGELYVIRHGVPGSVWRIVPARQ